jgi:hypothetical protein
MEEAKNTFGIGGKRPVCGWVLLKWILKKKRGVTLWTGFKWLRIRHICRLFPRKCEKCFFMNLVMK